MNGTPERVMSGDVPIASPSIGTEKRCTKCKELKPLSEFYPYKRARDGYNWMCKACNSQHAKEWYAAHREEMKKRAAEWRTNNISRHRENVRRWQELNPERTKELGRRWSKNNPEKRREQRRKRKWSIACVERKKERAHMWYLANREETIERANRWRANNLDADRKNKRAASQKRRLIPQIRLSQSLSSAIGRSLKEGKSGVHWEKLTGYTVEQIRAHLEKRFKPGMFWSNYGRGGWHIDHIIPISAFNFETPEDIDFKRCWALKNLQPMWEDENIRKSNRLEKSFQPSLLLCTGCGGGYERDKV